MATHLAAWSLIKQHLLERKAKGGRRVIYECGSHVTAMVRTDTQHKP